MSHSAPPRTSTRRGGFATTSVSPLARVEAERLPVRASGQPWTAVGTEASSSTRSAIPALSNRSTAATVLSSEHGWLGDFACLAPGELHVEHAVERTGALLGPGDDLLRLGALADWPGYADLQRHLVEAQRDRDRRIG